MVEGTGLENRHTGEPGIESSNLSLSVQLLRAAALCAQVILRAEKRCWDGWPSGLRRTPGKCTRQKCDFRHGAGFTSGRSRYSRHLPVPIAGLLHSQRVVTGSKRVVAKRAHALSAFVAPGLTARLRFRDP